MAAAKQAAGKDRAAGRKVVAENRKARHDYHIVETYEAGLALQGTEVKSIRAGGANLAEAYVLVRNGAATISGMHIAPYEQGNIHNHDPMRERALLLHRREIDELDQQVSRRGLTIVPLDVHFVRGRAKLTIGVARGKQRHDKRSTIQERDVKRQIERELKSRRG